MSTLLDKMIKTGTVKGAAVFADSKFFNERDHVPTDLPILNIAFSGSLKGGLLSGLTVIAGMSKTFKTMLSLYCMKAYMDKYPEGIAILYDSEFGITPEYIASFGIDTSRVLHIPVKDVEELKFDLVSKLDEIDAKDKVFIMVDSIGNLASKKELEDAQNEKSVADMSRAKSIKSLFRIVTPYLTTKDIPCVVINHIYQTQELYSKAVVSGGCLDGDSEIIMADHTFRKIRHVVPGEMVATLEGPKEVQHAWTPETLENGYPECYEIEFEDGHKVICSDIHQFMDENGEWVAAEDINVGDVFVTK